MATTSTHAPPSETRGSAQPADPYAAAQSLRATLDEVGILLPSLGAEAASPDLRLVELGRVRADVALRLADAVRCTCHRQPGAAR